METAEVIAEPIRAQKMVGMLLSMAGPDRDRQEKVLCEALTRMNNGLEVLIKRRLSDEEQGNKQTWQNQFDLKTALVAEITRVLAERFGR